MKYFFQNLKNNIDFFLRKNLDFSRKNYFVMNEPKDNLFNSKNLKEREQFLFQKYELEFLKLNSSRENYLENLYILDVLDKYLEIDFKVNLNVLDIGCKNWFYAKGEYFFFKKFSENLTLKGIEIDANRLYTNFYTRKEVAQFHIKNLFGAEYIAGDFLAQKEKFDYIVWVLPFITKSPFVKWGLPLKYFQPKKMFKHAYESLNPNGKIFIINQGAEEYEEQKKLCGNLGISYQVLDKVDSEFIQYENKRYSIVITN